LKRQRDSAAFKKIIWKYYRAHRRDFPWRNTRDPYRILVSEIMLQQTQAPRVVSKYEEFIARFPTVQTLARASVSDVLAIWKGLGYNRRALALKRAAEIIMREHGGKVPRDIEKLIALPGVGKATAGDVLAFAWNIPVVVIETNIRSVFLHFFFPNVKNVHDRDILPLIEKTLDQKNPREWYAALMDYGAMLKRTHGNASRKSAHYAKQLPFKGSNREARARILFAITEKPATATRLTKTLKLSEEIVTKNLAALEKEGFIASRRGVFSVK
jgi:A/G-specific adenine glycosylase